MNWLWSLAWVGPVKLPTSTGLVRLAMSHTYVRVLWRNCVSSVSSSTMKYRWFSVNRPWCV
jgi:hypothetical protein